MIHPLTNQNVYIIWKDGCDQRHNLYYVIQICDGFMELQPIDNYNQFLPDSSPEWVPVSNVFVVRVCR